MGSFDDFHKIADIAEKYGMWFHVDACWGGFLRWSKEGDKLFDGAERSDSFAFNPHKGWGVPN